MIFRNLFVGILAAWVASDIVFGSILYASSKQATGEMKDIFGKLNSPEGFAALGAGAVVGALTYFIF